MLVLISILIGFSRSLLLMILLHRDAERNMRNFRGRLFIGVLYKGITPDIIFWPHVRVIENGVIFLLRSGSLHFLLLGEMDENLILQKGLHDPKNLKGDICRFITQREWGPGNKKWRMPTLDELKLLGDGVRETTASTPGWGYDFWQFE